MRKFLAVAVFAALPACTTTEPLQTVKPVPQQPKFVRIGEGPPLEQALAYCRIQSSGAEKGYMAFGSTAFIAGAAIGNVIDNAIRVDRFMNDCIILMGWKKTDPRARW